MPVTARADCMKFKQVLLNLILQSISGTYKGQVKINSEVAYEDSIPHVKIEIENSKFELQKKDTMRIVKLAKMTDFKSILKSKVDINLKIAKLISSAIQWKMDFSSVKGSKFAMIFPVTPNSTNIQITDRQERQGPQPMTEFLNNNLVP